MKIDQTGGLSWTVAAVTTCYVLWSAFSLSRRVSAFGTIFTGLGAEVPPITRLAIALGQPPVVWSLTVLALAVLIAKELVISSISARLVLSVIIFITTALIMALVTEALFQPMLELMRHVG